MTHAARAGEIMTKALVCARPEQDLRDVESLLIEHRIGGVPVIEGDRLVGVVSRGDIARVQVLMDSLDGLVSDRLGWSGEADGFEHTRPAEFRGFRTMIAGLKVKDAMQEKVVTCAPTTPVGEVAAAMVRQHTHRVIVVEGEHPVGIISSLDLVKLLTPSQSDVAKR